MLIIESYSFGTIIIAGVKYSKDVIIFPDDHIHHPWWRAQGHRLAINDLDDLLLAKPEVIVAGTGAMGLMRPTAELTDFLAQHDIELIAQPSSEAVETFNRLSGNRKLGGCFHLTC
jgi:hypothetical protein